MKFIHVSDLHLGAKFKKLTTQKANVLREEEMHQVSKLFDYAKSIDCEAIFIAGDLFDGKTFSQKLMKSFFDIVERSKIKTFYVRGNHDEEFVTGKVPDNFYVFDDEIKCHEFDSYSVSGQQGTENLIVPIFKNDKFHFHLLHGDVYNPSANDGINLRAFEKAGIDYLALGHIHAFDSGKLGENGRFVYSGSLFSHGFDECGEHGFIEIELDGQKESHRFVNFAKREFVIVDIDITGLEKFDQLCARMNGCLKEIDQNSLVRAILTGSVSENCEKFMTELAREFENKFFYYELVDGTKLKIDLNKLKEEKLSFKSEFLRLVEEENSLDESDKNIICRLGIEALRGDDLSV